MFNQLSQRFQNVFKHLRSRGRLGPKEIESALRDIRRAFLEADAPYRIIKDFLERVKEKSLGQVVLQSITPARQVQKIVYEELTLLLGEKAEELKLKSPSLMMVVGLQGVGKTTTCAKLAGYYLKKGFNPYLIPADQKRAAATDQLITLAQRLDCHYFKPEPLMDSIKVCQKGIESARILKSDLIIMDTAGRLHIDEALMNELNEIKKLTQPNHTLLVVDAMTGQDAIRSTLSFHEKLEISGTILSKADGDARGGATIAMKAATGRPILFMGTGEALDKIELFHPDRMASRILALGDLASLVEKAQSTLDLKDQKDMIVNNFDFNDLLNQFRQLRKMGPIKDLLPQMGSIDMNPDENHIKRVESIILSMTPTERKTPSLINGSRRRRIANGSGTRVQDVNQLLKQVQAMKKLSKSFKKGKLGKFLPNSNFLWKNLK